MPADKKLTFGDIRGVLGCSEKELENALKTTGISRSGRVNKVADRFEFGVVARVREYLDRRDGGRRDGGRTEKSVRHVGKVMVEEKRKPRRSRPMTEEERKEREKALAAITAKRPPPSLPPTPAAAAAAPQAKATASPPAAAEAKSAADKSAATTVAVGKAQAAKSAVAKSVKSESGAAAAGKAQAAKSAAAKTAKDVAVADKAKTAQSAVAKSEKPESGAAVAKDEAVADKSKTAKSETAAHGSKTAKSETTADGSKTAAPAPAHEESRRSGSGPAASSPPMADAADGSKTAEPAPAHEESRRSGSGPAAVKPPVAAAVSPPMAAAEGLLERQARYKREKEEAARLQDERRAARARGEVVAKSGRADTGGDKVGSKSGAADAKGKDGKDEKSAAADAKGKDDKSAKGDKSGERSGAGGDKAGGKGGEPRGRGKRVGGRGGVASPSPSGRGTIRLDEETLLHHRRKREQKNKIVAPSAAVAAAPNAHQFKKPVAPIVREVKIGETVAVSKLAAEMSLKTGVVMRKLMEHGMTVTANDLLDRETAWIIVEELGHKAVDAPVTDLEQEVLAACLAEDAERLARAPVVTVMGHVDHGKTSLLDYIRKSRVVSGEAGGITQHIGAYRVESAIGAVTFIDTPGHALFTQMRARGAKVTDIVVLVVAADDGVKEQTVEAINHAKAAEVPVVVAVNKMDKPEADLEAVKRDLSQHGIVPDEWGGDNIFAPVSAHSGEGVDAMLDALATQAEIMELRAPRATPGRGVVIETRIDKGRGVIATVVVTHGTIRKGDVFLCGSESGRVRTMRSVSAADVRAAAPSEAVEVQGLSGVPEAGADFVVVEDDRKAREIADMRRARSRDKGLAHSMILMGGGEAAAGDGDADGGGEAMSDEARAAMLLDQPRETVDLNLVVKADVDGSREALAAAVGEIAGAKAKVKVVHSAVGAVTESDVYLAQTGKGQIVAFNVRANAKARSLAEQRGVKIIYGNIIYDLVEKVRDALLNLLPPVVEEKVIGMVDVREIYNIDKVGVVAGCAVTDGKILANSQVRLVRDGVAVYDGKVGSLYHFKNAVAEATAGSECGLSIAKYNDIKVGDVIEAIERTELPPEM